MFIKITQVSIEISKMIHFSFTFKLNEKRKVLLKNIIWRGMLQGNICWRGEVRSLIEVFKIFQKEVDLTRKEWRKNWGVRPSKILCNAIVICESVRVFYIPNEDFLMLFTP